MVLSDVGPRKSLNDSFENRIGLAHISFGEDALHVPHHLFCTFAYLNADSFYCLVDEALRAYLVENVGL